jgi:beta-galactosidase
MKLDLSKIILYLIAVIFLSGCEKANPRQKILFDFDWKFYRGDVENAELADFNDSTWRLLDLPHDWSIEDIPGTDSPIDSAAIGGINTGYYVGGTSWYRKTFDSAQRLVGQKTFGLF